MSEAFDERQRIVGLLRHWGQRSTPWPGIPDTHQALLLMLANVFDGPRTATPFIYHTESGGTA